MIFWRIAFIPLWLAVPPIWGVIIDQIAVRVDNSIVKDSDISRNLRVTDFLNNDPLRLNEAARKKAVQRLIDQVFIREEIRIGDYPRAEWSAADEQLAKLKKARFASAAAFDKKLSQYGINEPDLRFEFQWQLTVLRFIDARFRPAVLVNDSEIQKYYREHKAQLRRKNGSTPALDDASEQIRETITGEKVNDLFFSWLDEKRKTNKVVFYEEDLR